MHPPSSAIPTSNRLQLQCHQPSFRRYLEEDEGFSHLSLPASFYKTTRSPSSFPYSSVTSSQRPPKSTASQLHARSSSEAPLSFLASYAPSSSLLPNSSAAMPPSYYLGRQSLGSASSAHSSQRGVPSIYLIATQVGLASALYHALPISSNPFRTHQTSTTCHQPLHLHSPAKQLTSPSSL
jgi:hypothetical protein